MDCSDYRFFLFKPGYLFFFLIAVINDPEEVKVIKLSAACQKHKVKKYLIVSCSLSGDESMNVFFQC